MESWRLALTPRWYALSHGKRRLSLLPGPRGIQNLWVNNLPRLARGRVRSMGPRLVKLTRAPASSFGETPSGAVWLAIRIIIFLASKCSAQATAIPCRSLTLRPLTDNLGEPFFPQALLDSSPPVVHGVIISTGEIQAHGHAGLGSDPCLGSVASRFPINDSNRYDDALAGQWARLAGEGGGVGRVQWGDGEEHAVAINHLRVACGRRYIRARHKDGFPDDPGVVVDFPDGVENGLQVATEMSKIEVDKAGASLLSRSHALISSLLVSSVRVGLGSAGFHSIHFPTSTGPALYRVASFLPNQLLLRQHFDHTSLQQQMVFSCKEPQPE